ncbi:MAG: hypothetical protein CMH46_16695 [Muricauda sp.]|nr:MULTISPECIES: hypothetical protein [unclassified Allomuricauda]MAU17168.1 hypothetical protein [Allomuricauda sp.]|tara:strand:+ start:7947 stop:8156 length:210 start_codon:yes stop_codon:yes gene_type:complete
MKKLFLSLAVVLLFSGSALNASSPETPLLEEDLANCAGYATTVGLIYAGEGLNYWEGYFAGYGYCLENL